MPGLWFVWRYKATSVAAGDRATELVVDARPDQIDVLTDLYRSCLADCGIGGIEWCIDRRVAEHDAQILSLDGPVAAQRRIPLRSRPSSHISFRQPKASCSTERQARSRCSDNRARLKTNPGQGRVANLRHPPPNSPNVVYVLFLVVSVQVAHPRRT